MNAAREEQLFGRALALPADQRAAWIKNQCGGDTALRLRLEALLAAHEVTDSFLGEPTQETRPLLESESPEAPDEAVGVTVGRYKLLEKIGEGGCGVVYVAEQTEPLRRRVALKVIKLGMDTKQVLARFEAERQALARMDHPNIAKVLDAGATKRGRPYIVMELVRGIRITDYCDQHQLTTRERLDLFIRVCQAIQHAHQKGIIHRDIKPSNILVTLHDGVPVPKVIDFGIAKATEGRLTEATVYTQLHQFIGTPAYMSPEQAAMSGLDIDTRSDIYSLGVLLYELLTGDTPFDTQKLMASGIDGMRKTIREREPMRPSTRLTQQQAHSKLPRAHRQSAIPGDLDWIAMKCLEKDRSRRYETANALAMDLKRHLHDEPVAARPPSRVYRLQKMFRRNKLAFTSGVAIAAALIIGLGVAVWQFQEKSKAYTRARAAESEQRKAKLEAQEAQANESRQRVQAQDTADRLAEVLDQIDIRKAQDFFAANDTPEALATLAHVLRRNPRNEVAVSRLLFALSGRNYPLLTVHPLSHNHWVWAAHFSPDGQRLLTHSSDQTARVWDTRTGQPIQTLAHQANVTSAQFSPDGQRVATASEDKLARIWDLKTEKSLPLPHDGIVWFVRFSPQGNSLLTAAWDGTARLWEVASGIELTPPLRHEKEVYSGFFSPDGQRALTASIDGTARIWSARTGAALVRPLQHPSKLWFARFSSDGLKVATACEDGTAQVWDSESGEPLTPPLRHAEAVLFVEFSPNGEILATASADHHARLFNVSSGQLIATLRHESVVRSARFSPDGARIVTASDDNTARVWSAAKGELLMEPLRHQAEVWHAEFSPNGRLVATASIDRTAQIWDVTAVPEPRPPLRHPSAIASAEFSANGRLLFVCSSEGAVQVWDAQSAKPLVPGFSEPEGTAAVVSAAFSLDGQSILTISRAHEVRVRHRDGRQAIKLEIPPASHPVWARFSSDGKQIITVSQPSAQREPSEPSVWLQTWDSSTGRALGTPWAADGTFTGLHWGTNRIWLLTILPNGTVQVWDVRHQQPIGNPLKTTSAIRFAQFSPDAERILTLSTDSATQVWNTRQGEAVTKPLHQRDPVASAQFSPDGHLVLTVTEQTFSLGRNVRLMSIFQVWDAQTGVLLSESAKHEGKVTAAEFSPDGQRILAAVGHKGAWVWDSRTGEALTELLHQGTPVHLARFSPDGQRLVCASGELAWVLELEKTPVPVPPWLPEFAEAIAGKRFNEHRAVENVPPGEFLLQSQRIGSSRDASPYTRWAQRFLGDRVLEVLPERLER